MTSGQGDDSEGTARETDSTIAIVPDVDFPDLGPAAKMDGCREGPDDPLAHGAEMVRVDLEPHDHLGSLVDVHPAADTRDRLGQSHRGTTM